MSRRRRRLENAKTRHLPPKNVAEDRREKKRQKDGVLGTRRLLQEWRVRGFKRSKNLKIQTFDQRWWFGLELIKLKAENLTNFGVNDQKLKCFNLLFAFCLLKEATLQID